MSPGFIVAPLVGLAQKDPAKKVHIINGGCTAQTRVYISDYVTARIAEHP